MVKKSKVKKEKKVIDTSKFYHNVWQGNTLLQLVNALPKPAQPEFESVAEQHSGTGSGASRVRPHSIESLTPLSLLVSLAGIMIRGCTRTGSV